MAQLRGFYTTRKIVVIESDDWGSIRTKNKVAQQIILAKYPKVINDPYFQFDALEDKNDLSALFEVLTSVKDKNQNHACITANMIMANPDFIKIKKDNFQKYYYEKFTTTLYNRDKTDEVLQMTRYGIKINIFKPQLHGREHLSVNQWLNELNNAHEALLLAFDNKMFGIPIDVPINKRNNVMAALDFMNPIEVLEHEKILAAAQSIFKETFGFDSKTFIAPCYVWGKSHEPILKKLNINTLQGLPYQLSPSESNNYKTSIRYTGMQSKAGLTHLVRNAFFEPSLVKNKESVVGDCLKRIDLAFKTYKPAIIGSHRLNFIGSLDEKNRTDNLKSFKILLEQIVSKWPDVEFMSSDQLAGIMQNPSR